MYIPKFDANVSALQKIKCVQQQIIESDWDSNLFMGSTLVHKHAKWQSLEDASRVFNKMPSRLPNQLGHPCNWDM